MKYDIIITNLLLPLGYILFSTSGASGNLMPKRNEENNDVFVHTAINPNDRASMNTEQGKQTVLRPPDPVRKQSRYHVPKSYLTWSLSVPLLFWIRSKVYSSQDTPAFLFAPLYGRVFVLEFFLSE